MPEEPKAHRWVNATATVEIMIEVPEGEPTPKQFDDHLDTKAWRHVSRIRVIAERIETY